MAKESLLIKNARVIDPGTKLDGVRDVFIANGVVKEIAVSLSNSADLIIEAAGKILMPALVDMHVHLRQPGREDKETIFSGTQAALKGGVTAVLTMPNTEPAIDSPERLKLLKDIIAKTACADVFMVAAMTEKREGLCINDFAALKKEGAIAVSDDGASVDNPELMRQILTEAKKEGLLAICHCQDKALDGEGAVNLGFTSTRLGLMGISKESEYQRVKRDIELAEEVAARVHIAHVSCKESVEAIAQAKKRGVKVTAETAPHYFSFSEEAVLSYDTNMKMNPPLRTRADLESIKQALKDGTLDAIASDHAPHTACEKDIEFDRAAFGVIGLETELAAAITELLHGGWLSWLQIAEKLSYHPAQILGINKGTLSPGSPADIIIISPDAEWTVEKENFLSLSKNSCFLGRKLKGLVNYTLYRGKVVYQR